MKLWKLGPQKEYKGQNSVFDWGCKWGFIIRAKSEEDARKFAHKNAGREKHVDIDRENGIKKDTWMEPKYTYCIEIPVEGKKEIILEEFLDG